MSHKTNYSKMSTDVKVDDIVEQVTPAVEDEIVEDVIIENVVEETVGTVIDCSKLNIRKEPNINAAIDGTIKRGDSVIIHEEIGDFYRIGTNQYCMKKFIEIEK